MFPTLLANPVKNPALFLPENSKVETDLDLDGLWRCWQIKVFWLHQKCLRKLF